jgi:membrane fusion protein (multidrug efflux system)
MATATKPQPVASAPDRDAADTPPKRSRTRIVLPILGVLVIIGGVWFGKRWTYSRAHVSTDDAQVDGTIVPVLAKVGGYIRTVNVSDNTAIAQNAVAVTIDDAELRVHLAQAEADLAAAQSIAGGGRMEGAAEAQVTSASRQRDVTEAQIAAARANQQKAASDLARMKELADKQIVSRQQLDAMQAASDAANANLSAAERQAGVASATVSNAEAGTRVANARLLAAKAARDNAALQLSYATVAAPMGGIVSRKQVEIGQLVQPGQPLFTIVSDSGVWVTANFKETQLAGIRTGRPVEIHVDAYDGCIASGTVESVSAATGARFALLPPDNATGNFPKVVQRVPVRIKIVHGCGDNRPLRPGMSVVASVEK